MGPWGHRSEGPLPFRLTGDYRQAVGVGLFRLSVHSGVAAVPASGHPPFP
ncbi:MAG: hypothetical protein NZM65_01525 [Flavobacteriales bacterium]|nr:hypothetical protein [Flavobacteriales bacterium]MDW8409348.1 hypothetical protein [Flavobacteriales bacterium]